MAIDYSYAFTKPADNRTWVTDLLTILGASVVIALFAPISLRLPFTPIPIGTQSHVVLFLSLFLGSRRASLAVLAYLFQGIAGLPVFSGGHCGILWLAGPTGGYLLGYLAGAYVTGLLMEKASERTPGRAFGAMAVGNLVIYFFGFSWLSQFVGVNAALTLGVLPFLIGDFLKLIVCARFAKRRLCA